MNSQVSGNSQLWAAIVELPYLFTEGALDFSPTKRNLLLILEISHQPVGEKCHTI